MNRTMVSSGQEVIVHLECITGYAFKMAESQNTCALLARQNHLMTQNFAGVREKCAHFAWPSSECLSPAASSAA